MRIEPTAEGAVGREHCEVSEQLFSQLKCSINMSPCHNQIQMYRSNQILLAYVITEYEMYNHSSTLFLIVDVFILSCLLRILKV